MGLSSDTLIHFTSSKKALKGILSDNFRLKYCKETIKWANNSTNTIYVPMISFCDMPLSQIKTHISKYGHYGIGLSREWAIRNKLNPVLYIEPNSNIANSYKALIKYFTNSKNKNTENQLVRRQLLDIIRYIKNYEGALTRAKKVIAKYRFSDEREWRYVPDYTAKCKLIYASADFNIAGVKELAAQSLSGMRLEFTPADVKYIIIKNDNEISEFIDYLRKVKSKSYTHSDVERLTTRLLTSEQIHSDI